MKLRGVFFLIFFLFFSKSIIASEIDGIRIFQSAEGFLKIDNSEDRELEFNKNIRVYWNDSFNLSSSVYDSNDFEIPNPDYFFNEYGIFEKEKNVIGIFRTRNLTSKILQQNFKIGECEQLRDQLVLEKEVKFNTEIRKTKSKSYYRSAEENVIYFEDRLAFNYVINDNSVSHIFSCYYEVHFEKDAGLGKKHLITNSLAEEIIETNLLNQFTIFYQDEKIKEFNSNFIKNFKIWGNSNEINYDLGETFLLKNYRLESFQKHNEIKKQKNIEAQKKAEEEKKRLEKEKQRKINDKKISKLINDIVVKKSDIKNRKEKLSLQIFFIKKPINELKKKKDKRFKEKYNLLQKIKDQENSFKSNFRRIYEAQAYDSCFPSFNPFVSKIESAYAKLTLAGKDDKHVKYSINYEAYDETDEALFFLDFVKDKTTCEIYLIEFEMLDTLNLNNINFRFFNKYGKYNVEIPKINSKTNNKLEQISEEIENLNKEIDKNKKIIILEIEELEKLFNAEKDRIDIEIKDIENQINEIEKQNAKLYKNYESSFSSSKLLIPKKNPENKLPKIKDDEVKQVTEFEKKDLYDPNHGAKIIAKSKIDSADVVKKNNDISQNQDGNIQTTGLTLSEEDVFKQQIFGCWSIPLGIPYKPDLLVRIKLKLKPDGSIAKIEIMDQAKMNKPGEKWYKILAESAVRAIKLCEPLRVPTTGYERWKELQLNFDAREMLEG